MSTHQAHVIDSGEPEPLKTRLQRILKEQNLQEQRNFLLMLSADMRVDFLDCAAALLHIVQQHPDDSLILPVSYLTPVIKMVRYRLDVGKKHQLTAKDLKKLLVEESGVDKNNINNVMIHGQYTLVELPDEMPQDIFQHLKTVEINQQKLNIRRLKSRTKKQGHTRFRRAKSRDTKLNDSDLD